MDISVVIPTHNRRPILEKVLLSLADQDFNLERVEVIVVDDGSSDGTETMFTQLRPPYLARLLTTGRRPGEPLRNSGIAKNIGIRAATGAIVAFLDSDMVVARGFLRAHVQGHSGDRLIVNGPFVQTSNLQDPRAQKRRWTDVSRAFFCGGNSSIRREWLERAGLFDEDFTEYGWEDLELGVRLKTLGLKSVISEEALGYHYKPESHEYDLNSAIAREEARARMAAIFLRKHPTFEVRLMVLDLRAFYCLEALLTIGAWPDWASTRRLVAKLGAKGRGPLVLFLAKFVTAHAYAKTLKVELRKA